RCTPNVTLLRWSDIRRDDLLHRFRLDAELSQTRQRPARHIVRFEQVNLRRSERWVWQKLEQARLNLGHGKGYWHEQTLSANETQHELVELAQRIHLWTGELIDSACSPCIADHACDSLGHILSINGLQAGVAATDQRQHRKAACESGHGTEQS